LLVSTITHCLVNVEVRTTTSCNSALLVLIFLAQLLITYLTPFVLFSSRSSITKYRSQKKEQHGALFSISIVLTMRFPFFIFFLQN